MLYIHESNFLGKIRSNYKSKGREIVHADHLKRKDVRLPENQRFLLP